MNLQTWKDLDQSVSNFQDYCIRVPMSSLVIDCEASQCRQAGHRTDMVPQFAETLKKSAGWPFPPISCKKLPDGRFEVKDGNTRALAAEKVGAEVWVCTYHSDIHDYNDAQWKKFQIQQNDHPQAASNSAADLEAYVHELIENDTLTLNIGYAYKGNEKDWIKNAAKYCNEITPNSGKSLSWWKKAIQRSMDGKVSSCYTTYSRDQLIAMYKNSPEGRDWGGEKHGDIDDDGNHVWAAVSNQGKTPNVIGALTNKSLSWPGNSRSQIPKRHIIIYGEQRMAGKDDERLMELRREMLSYFEAVAEQYNMQIDILIAPQIKKGRNREDMFKFVTVQKD